MNLYSFFSTTNPSHFTGFPGLYHREDALAMRVNLTTHTHTLMIIWRFPTMGVPLNHPNYTILVLKPMGWSNHDLRANAQYQSPALQCWLCFVSNAGDRPKHCQWGGQSWDPICSMYAIAHICPNKITQFCGYIYQHTYIYIYIYIIDVYIWLYIYIYVYTIMHVLYKVISMIYRYKALIWNATCCRPSLIPRSGMAGIAHPAGG